MDVTFVLEESGVTATVEVPCEADVAAAKEVACTALAVSPASVEMRIGTQVLEGTCRLQDTAFDSGVQVVLARPRFADIKCPAECSVDGVQEFSLSPCGALCLFTQSASNINMPTLCHVTGFDTETFSPAFRFKVDFGVYGPPAISRCRTRCYMACKDGVRVVALPGGEVVRKVACPTHSVHACGGGVVLRCEQGLLVYDEDLTLLHCLLHERCLNAALSPCGGWVITSSFRERNARLWDVNTGEAVVCVPADGWHVALSRSASVFAVEYSGEVQLYDWSGAALGTFEKAGYLGVCSMQFTPCGKYLVARLVKEYSDKYSLHQYDVATMSCVRVFPDVSASSFAISPCSRVVVFTNSRRDTIVTRHLICASVSVEGRCSTM